MNSVLREALSSSVRNSFLQEGLILRIFKNVLGLLGGQVRIKTTGGITRNRGRGDYQRRTILHSLRQSCEGVTSGDNKGQDRGSSLGLSSSRNNSFQRNRCPGRNGCGLTNPFSISTIFFGYRLGWRDKSLSKNSMCNSRGSRCCKGYIGPIKKALHGYTYGGRKLFSGRAIHRKGLRLILKRKEKYI